MAGRKHPVTFRTRKLSFSAPMVLHSGGCGRVGRRRPLFWLVRKAAESFPGLFCVCGGGGSGPSWWGWLVGFGVFLCSGFGVLAGGWNPLCCFWGGAEAG